MMKTHQFNIRSRLHSWWPTRQPWTTLIVAVLILRPVVDGKWETLYNKPYKPCGFTYNELEESTTGNIVLFYKSGKPLEMTCNLDPNNENVKMLFGGQMDPKQSPSSRIVFMNMFDEKYVDPKYVSIINNTAAKLVIPDPPVGDTFISCIMLSDAYFTTNITTKTVNLCPHVMCHNNIRVIELEDIKLNIIRVTDTTIDMKLDWPMALVFFDQSNIYIDYDTDEEKKQTVGPKTTLNNNYSVKNETVISLQNLESYKVYSISSKYCLGEGIHLYCSKLSTPIRVRTAKRPVNHRDAITTSTTSTTTVDDVVKTPIPISPTFTLADLAGFFITLY